MPEGLEGRVIDINFMYTILKTEEGNRISVPNNMFAQKFVRRRAGAPAPRRTLAEQLEAERPLED
jgi:small-conductance mechanosensitive channel